MLLTLMLSYSAQASDWTRITQITPGVVYIDRSSIKHKDDTYGAWLKIIGPDKRYAIEYLIFKDDWVRISDIQCYKFNGDGMYCPESGRWRRVAPDTMADTIYKWLKQHTSWF